MDGIYSDPIHWIWEQYTWFFSDPVWLVVASLMFWPVVLSIAFVRAWYLDSRNRRRGLARRRAELGKEGWAALQAKHAAEDAAFEAWRKKVEAQF